MAIHTELHTDVPLTNYSRAYKNEAFIGDLVCPPVQVAKDKDLYYIYGTEDIKKIDTLRAPKTASKGVSRSLSTTTYICNPHGLHELVDDKDRKNADKGLDPELDAVDGIMELMAISKEIEIATLMTTSSNYASATYYKDLSTDGIQWNDAGGVSDPIGDIEDAKAIVYAGCLRPANSLILPYAVALALAKNPSVTDRIKYTQGTTISAGVPQLASGLAQVLGVQVFIALSAYDATREGQSGKTLTSIWGDYAVLFYLNPATSWKSMSFCKNFNVGGTYVDRIAQPDLGNNTMKIEVNDPGRDPKMICNSAAYLFIDTLAA